MSPRVEFWALVVLVVGQTVLVVGAIVEDDLGWQTVVSTLLVAAMVGLAWLGGRRRRAEG